ncbi:DUF3618 domain-containing protein [Agromyces sp. NPDC058064]|uniref:DUF3618 domain-containing protein n=1 Tax=Agromyces sp. NPDC058064 TaxID=3346322 RepID=UPI0036D75ADF
MSNPDVIREDIERTRTELGQDVDALADKVNPSKVAERQGRKVKHALTRLKDRVMGVASDAGHDARDAMSDAGSAIADAPRKVAATAQGNPIAVGLMAFGAGLLAASLIPASKAEERVAEKAKEAAEPLVDEVTEAVKDSAGHLKEPAQDAAIAVKDRAAEAVETVKEEGADALDGVRTQEVAGQQDATGRF